MTSPGVIGALGAGLCMCRGLVSAHEAMVSLESQAAIGTTATIFLPAARLTRQRPSLELLQESS